MQTTKSVAQTAAAIGVPTQVSYSLFHKPFNMQRVGSYIHRRWRADHLGVWGAVSVPAGVRGGASEQKICEYPRVLYNN